jgi:hypothetical protein
MVSTFGSLAASPLPCAMLLVAGTFGFRRNVRAEAHSGFADAGSNAAHRSRGVRFFGQEIGRVVEQRRYGGPPPASFDPGAARAVRAAAR